MKIKQFAVFGLQFSVLTIALLIGASFPLQVGSAQFIDRITRPCSSGVTSRALVITNPNNTGNVEITTCTGGSVTINGTAVVPGGATTNPTNTFIPYRSNATTFLDSPLARTSATVITSTAAFNGPAGGVNTATYSFAAEPTLGWIRGAAGQLTATSGGTIGWFDTNGWHGFGTKVEVFNDTSTSTDGFIATTNGNATVGVQKLSPRIRLSGSGWKTNAVAGAQMTDWIVENQPVEGAANPSANLTFSSQINTGGYTPNVTFTSGGNVNVGTPSRADLAPLPSRMGIYAASDSDKILLLAIQGQLFPYSLTFGVNQTLEYTEIQSSQYTGGGKPLVLNAIGGNVGVGDVTPAALFTVGNGDLFQVSTTGNVLAPTYSTATNCADPAGAAACGGAAAGSVVIDAGATSVIVSTTAVTDNSQIQLTFDSSLGARLGVTCNVTAALPYVTARTGATSFTISVAVAPITNPICLSYAVVN